MKTKNVVDSLERVVPVFGKINYESMLKTMGEVMSFWKKDHNKEIKLVICSMGGMCDPSFMFIDTVRVNNINLTTIGSGGVGSMAVLVFACGRKRLITRHTVFFFHDLGFTPDKEERLSVTELEKRSKNFMVTQRWYAELIEEQTEGKFKASKVLKLMKAETYLYPKELVELGLAHEII